MRKQIVAGLPIPPQWLSHILSWMIGRPGKPRLVLLEQNGVLVQEIGRHLTRPEDIHLVPGAAAAVAQLNRAGVKAVICSNQDVVGRGEMSLETLEQIRSALCERLAAAARARLDEIIYCVDDPGRPTRRHKPGCGMLEEAITRFGADPKDTPVIGDQLTDLQAAVAMGCPRYLVKTGKGSQTASSLPASVLPVSVHEHVLAAVVNILISLRF